MARERSRIEITCQNRKCPYFLKELGKDIVKRGKNRLGRQQYFCNHCRSWFVETANTLAYRRHLSEDEMANVYRLLVEQNGIRSIERITGHHRDTIGKLLEDMAEHAEQVNRHLIKDLGFTQFECERLWSMVKKSRRKLSETAQQGLKRVMHAPTSISPLKKSLRPM